MYRLVNCPQCQQPIEIVLKVNSKIRLKQNPSDNYFSTSTKTACSAPVCDNCRMNLNQQFLASLGLKHLDKNRPLAFGTNFYHTYKNEAPIYHQFSCAEDTRGLIFDTLKSYVNQSTTYLDVGCGTGKYINQLSPLCKHAYALEPSPELLEYAAKLNMNQTNITYLLAGAESIPLLSNSCDIISATWTTFSVNESIQEIIRVLKPGGTFVRIATSAKDDLTNLFPKFDIKVVHATNNWYVNNGFTSKNIDIDITFKDVNEAKNILECITGSKYKLLKSELKHKIVIQTYTKGQNDSL